VKSVNISEDNADFLDRQDNASALVNRLLTEYRQGDQAATAIKRYRLEVAQAELAEVEAKLQSKKDIAEAKRAEIEDLKSSLESQEDDREDILSDAANVFDRMSQSQLGEDNPAVQNWARKAGIDESELLDWYRTEYQGGDER
jgi:rRNA maturation endonuclease Nob1